MRFKEEGPEGMAKKPNKIFLEDRARLRDPVFTLAEALALTGLSKKQLLNWFDRGILAEFHDRPKHRGVRRKYSLYDLMYLAAVRELAAAGVPLLMAALTAIELAVLLGEFWRGRQAWPEIGIPEFMVAVHWPVDSPEKPRYEVFTGENPLPQGGILAWLRDHHITRCHVIDFGMVYQEFCYRLARLKERGKA